jgi:DNA-binding transcriptional regulator YiaG
VATLGIKSVKPHLTKGEKMNGKQFAEKRKDLGLTQKDFARISGKSIIAVASWESNRRRCPQYAVVLLDFLSRLKNPKAYRPPK